MTCTLKVEMQLNGTWTDVTADVMPPFKCTSGIQGIHPTNNRIADIGVCTFDLKNSESNSASTRGYYSPGKTTCRSGFQTNVFVRISFDFLGKNYPKWYGRIAPDGIDVDGGRYGTRRTHVVCYDYMFQLMSHNLNLMTYLTSVRGDQVLPYITGNLPYEPLDTDYSEGQSIFATCMDNITSTTTAYQAVNWVTVSEFGYCYLTHRRNNWECLRWEDRLYRNNVYVSDSIGQPDSSQGYLLLDGGGRLLLDGGGALLLSQLKLIDLTDIMHDSDPGAGIMFNRIIINFHPKKVDAAATSVLYATNKRLEIAAGATISGYKIQYKDPDQKAIRTNAIDTSMVEPVKDTDYWMDSVDGSDSKDLSDDLVITVTYGTADAEYTFQNTGASTGYIYFQARGKGVYDYAVISKIFEDTSYQTNNGTLPLTIDLVYQSDPTTADQFGNLILNQYKRSVFSLNSVSFKTSTNDLTQILLNTDCGSRVNLAEDQSGVNEAFFINGWTIESVENSPNLFNFEWKTKRAAYDAQVFAQWDTDHWDGVKGWAP